MYTIIDVFLSKFEYLINILTIPLSFYCQWSSCTFTIGALLVKNGEQIVAEKTGVYTVCILDIQRIHQYICLKVLYQ